MKDEPENGRRTKPVYRYTGIAGKMIAIILIGTFSGRKLDAVLDLQFPIFTLVLVLISVALAIYVIIKDVSK